MKADTSVLQECPEEVKHLYFDRGQCYRWSISREMDRQNTAMNQRPPLPIGKSAMNPIPLIDYTFPKLAQRKFRLNACLQH